MSESAAEGLRRAMSALGERHRFRLAVLLSERPRSVGELVQDTGWAQPLVSHHLGILCAAGVAGAKRDGRRRMYRLTEPEDGAARDLLTLFRRGCAGPDASPQTDASTALRPGLGVFEPETEGGIAVGREMDDYLL
jgi:DNA-binding transcriptional ArsR family regulator